MNSFLQELKGKKKIGTVAFPENDMYFNMKNHIVESESNYGVPELRTIDKLKSSVSTLC